MNTPLPDPNSPPPSPPPIDATIEMERPKDLKKPPAPPQPLDATLDATVAIERPQSLNAPMPPVVGDATVAMDRPDLAQRGSAPSSADGQSIPERRASNKASGQFEVKIPKPLPAYAKKLGEVLVQMGKMTPEQVEEAVRWARETGERLGHCLVRWNIVPPETVCRALSIQTGLPMTVLEEPSVPDALSKIFPLALMMHHGFVPFDQSPTVLCIAACNPLEPEVRKDLEKISKKIVEEFLAREDHVFRQLDWLRVKFKTRSRRTLRFNLALPSAYQFCTRQGGRLDKEIYDCVTVNVSEGGFLIDSPAPSIADPGEAMRRGLYINLCVLNQTEESEDKIWAVCEVRELRFQAQIDSGGVGRPRWLMGVEIIDINPEFKDKLKELCRGALKRK